jgi:hypothetical protein
MEFGPQPDERRPPALRKAKAIRLLPRWSRRHRDAPRTESLLSGHEARCDRQHSLQVSIQTRVSAIAACAQAQPSRLSSRVSESSCPLVLPEYPSSRTRSSPSGARYASAANRNGKLPLAVRRNHARRQVACGLQGGRD